MKGYDESGCFDPNPISSTDCQVLMGLDGGGEATTNNSHNILEMEDNLIISSYNYHHHHEDASAAAAVAAAVEMEIQHQQQHYMFENNNTTANNNTRFIPQLTHHQELSYDQSNWDAAAADLQSFNSVVPSSSSPEAFAFPPPTPDLLNLFHLPICPFLPNSSISFENASTSSVVYDPLLHLNLPPQPPFFRELLQSLPHGYTLPPDDRDPGGVGALYHDEDNEILEFDRCIPMAGHGKGRAGKTTKHFTSERERRVHIKDMYAALRKMVPNPTKESHIFMICYKQQKNDRASVVGDAIEYIKELLRTVRELKLLVEKKRCGRDRRKKFKTEDAASASCGAADAGAEDNVECKPLGDPDQCYNTNSLRSSWLQSKSKDSEVDVRIIDDEITIKLVQRKKINCFLLVSRLLDELQLDLQHAAGGNVGEYHSFLFNSKICEGSAVYASSIANILIELVDRQYAAAPSMITSTL